MKEETGVIIPKIGFQKMKYYDIYEFAKKKCFEYIHSSEENHNKFYWFSKEYKTFEPYLDFFLCHLGYAILNPLNYHNVIAYGTETSVIFKEIENQNNSLSILKNADGFDENTYRRCNEIALNIRNYTTDIEDDGIILPTGKFLTVDRRIHQTHEMIATIILNQYLIKNKELYEDFVKYIKEQYNNQGMTINESNYETTVINYLNKYLGCIWFVNLYTSYNYLYNSALLTENTKSIIEALNLNEENIGIDITKEQEVNKEEIKKYKKIIQNIYKKGEKNE